MVSPRVVPLAESTAVDASQSRPHGNAYALGGVACLDEYYAGFF
ncbi:hypothetical protein [Agrobacterium rosae]